MNRHEFRREIRPLWNYYREDNSWVGTWDKSWNDDDDMGDYVDAAFRLYQATSTNALRLVLLGGTGIRMNKHLVSNFGVTAANGIQDQPTRVHVVAEEAARQNDQVRPQPPVPVRGVGSILSENLWTPLLNDALIVGAAAAGQQFQIALENGYHESWRDCEQFIQWKADPEIREELEKVQRMNAALGLLSRHVDNNPRLENGSATKCARDKVSVDHAYWSTVFFHQRGPEFYKQVWQQFFCENLGLLWDTERQIPRVLARELIGLTLFGYEPEFKNMTLGFNRRRGAPPPKFADYVKLLRRLGMHGGKNSRAVVMKYLSKSLFGDELALHFPEDGFFKNHSSLRRRYVEQAKKKFVK